MLCDSLVRESRLRVGRAFGSGGFSRGFEGSDFSIVFFFLLGDWGGFLRRSCGGVSLGFVLSF